MLRPAAVLLLAAALPLGASAHRPATPARAATLGHQYSHPASDNVMKLRAAPKQQRKFPWWFLRRHIATTAV